jgi:hypothetical protein
MDNSVFFSENGLTSTSANHIANLAKETIQSIQQELDSTRFVNIDLGLIGSSDKQRILYGKPEEFINTIEEKLEQISKYTALIAWLREAIKAKDELFSRLCSSTYEEVAKNIGIEKPKEPEYHHVLTPTEYYDSLPIKERNRYYQLQAFCSVYGKYIHPDGSLSKARKEMNIKMSKPIDVQEDGSNTLIKEYSPSVNPQRLDITFFDLQEKYRSYQAQLNKIKYDCDTACQTSKVEEENRMKQERADFTAKMVEFNQKCSAWIEARKLEFNKIKIAIPDSLKSTYESLK